MSDFWVCGRDLHLKDSIFFIAGLDAQSAWLGVAHTIPFFLAPSHDGGCSALSAYAILKDWWFRGTAITVATQGRGSMLTWQ